MFIKDVLVVIHHPVGHQERHGVHFVVKGVGRGNPLAVLARAKVLVPDGGQIFGTAGCNNVFHAVAGPPGEQIGGTVSAQGRPHRGLIGGGIGVGH